MTVSNFNFRKKMRYFVGSSEFRDRFCQSVRSGRNSIEVGTHAMNSEQCYECVTFEQLIELHVAPCTSSPLPSSSAALRVI